LKKKSCVIAKNELATGYAFAVDNAISLLVSSTEIQSSHPATALALAQIGQEEIGKSLMILAAFGLTSSPDSWSWFWEGWKNHVRKAHRAYLYEIIHPLRIEMRAPDGTKYSGLPLYQPISKEKEIGLYVDFDLSTGRFIAPSSIVTSFEAAARISTLMYLSATADAVRRALLNDDTPFRLQEFGTIALRLCTENVYQQDMPLLIEEFSAKSTRHAAIITDLNVALSSVKALFKYEKGNPVASVTPDHI